MTADKRLVIAIDCDDVLVPTAQLHLDAYNAKYNTQVQLKDFYSDSLWGAESEEIAAQRVDELLLSGATWNAVPDAETMVYVRKLAEAGHELHVVTGRQDLQQAETAFQLDKFYPGIFTSVEHTNMYASGKNAHLKRSKGEVCKAIRASILVDDHAGHVIDALDRGVEKAILYGNYPYNRDAKLVDGMIRAGSMAQVYEEVVHIAVQSNR